MKKNKKLLIGGIFGLLLVTIVGTYAYYTATSSNNNVVSGTASSANLELTVTKVAGGDILVPQLTTYLGDALTGSSSSCIDGNGNTVCQVYTITVTNTGTSTAVLSGTITLSGGSFNNLMWEELEEESNTRLTNPVSNKSTVTTLVSSLSLAANGTKTYRIVVWIAETSTNQNSTDTGSFNGTVSFNLGDGSGVTSSFTAGSSSAISTIMALATAYDDVDETANPSGIYAVSHSATSQTSATTDYRYYGTSPDNYATFNGETWRVIGVFQTNDGEYRIKLIKNESIGNYAFDSTDNDYGTSSLKTYLNGNYYNSLNSIGKEMIDSVTYYTAGYSTSEILTEEMYGYERGTAVAVSGTTNTSTYIGLMYPSDYGYAAGKMCVDEVNLYDYDVECTINDWLKLLSDEWLISPQSNISNNAWYVKSSGYINDDNYSIDNSFAIRPVLYLKSTVKIKSGDGKLDSPFMFE